MVCYQKDAYDSVIKDIQSEYTSDMYNLAETRATAIANGADVTSADKSNVGRYK